LSGDILSGEHFSPAESDPDGGIDLHEFQRWADLLLSSPMLRGRSQALEEASFLDFQTADRNGDGRIDKDEWGALLDAVAELVGKSCLQQLMQEWHRNPPDLHPKERCPPVASNVYRRAQPSPDVDQLLEELGL
ncbi:unnamed protein product, partial [Polarella glacialis]